MATAKKYVHSVAMQILSHNSRGGQTYENNEHIDQSKSKMNYSLIKDGFASDYARYKKRKNELYCMNRGDVKTLIAWVCTLPRGVPEIQERAFFEATYDFFCIRYRRENIVQAIVHHDEEGQPHMHICFVPAVPDHKHVQAEKICANDVMTRRDLMTFHQDWQRWLDDRGINARVRTGITKAQGGNRTVERIKRGDYETKVERTAEYGRWGSFLVEKREFAHNADSESRWRAVKEYEHEMEEGRW